ncbi:hypothetical protein [Heyndrickxia ginsengihumi]|uniref:hypothetical protein n=1 Tax=Heyndrickxia ginsengihumi TaxID=363870 RepID=UPI00068E195D|nr:hypothetical protein [Heyndrickxia ginsengihumi]
MQVYKYDDNGFFVEPVIIDKSEDGTYTIPENCTDKELPQPNYKPKFDKDKSEWVETLTEEEWLAQLPKPEVTKTPLEELQEKYDLMQKALDDLILGGAI